jgi:hypothetical protein
MYEGTRHSTATDAIRRSVSLDPIQAALRDADAASTCVYAHRRNQQVVAGRTGLESPTSGRKCAKTQASEALGSHQVLSREGFPD